MALTLSPDGATAICTPIMLRDGNCRIGGRVAASFVVYVDESGDEGFKFQPRESGSSRWFVMSAIVFRKSSL